MKIELTVQNMELFKSYLLTREIAVPFEEHTSAEKEEFFNSVFDAAVESIERMARMDAIYDALHKYGEDELDAEECIEAVQEALSGAVPGSGPTFAFDPESGPGPGVYVKLSEEQQKEYDAMAFEMFGRPPRSPPWDGKMPWVSPSQVDTMMTLEKILDRCEGHMHYDVAYVRRNPYELGDRVGLVSPDTSIPAAKSMFGTVATICGPEHIKVLWDYDPHGRQGAEGQDVNRRRLGTVRPLENRYVVGDQVKFGTIMQNTVTYRQLRGVVTELIGPRYVMVKWDDEDRPDPELTPCREGILEKIDETGSEG